MKTLFCSGYAGVTATSTAWNPETSLRHPIVRKQLLSVRQLVCTSSFSHDFYKEEGKEEEDREGERERGKERRGNGHAGFLFKSSAAHTLCLQKQWGQPLEKSLWIIIP